MKEIREEAEKHRKAKLEKYGADHKACGGSMHKYAHGGHVKHEGHPHKEHDKKLASEIKHEAEEIERDHKAHGGKVHRMDGGATPRLGRGRHKGGKKGTNVNIAIAPKGPDTAGAPMMLPPALGAGPGPGMPSAPPPRPMPTPGPAAAMPPRPGMPPMKRGGSVKEHEHKKSSHKAESHKRHHRTQHH